MDNMPLHFNLPQEDELATNLLSGGHSYYMSLWIMRNEKRVRKYFDFNPDLGASEEDKNVWTRGFLYFMKKIVLKENLLLRRNGLTQQQRRLVIKSPIHTGRIHILRKLFPRAKFVYIHRDPIEVFQSAVHMADTTYWFCYFASPSDEQIIDMIIWQFQYMFEQYNKAVLVQTHAQTHTHTQLSHTSRVLSKDVIEVAYEGFLADPMTNLKRIYEHANIHFDESIFEKELQALKDYKVNKFNSLSEHIKAYVKEKWIDYFKAFNYE